MAENEPFEETCRKQQHRGALGQVYVYTNIYPTSHVECVTGISKGATNRIQNLKQRTKCSALDTHVRVRTSYIALS